MILETVRIVADWLADGTYGVNAKLATVPRDGTDPLPTSVTVFDETRNGPAARRKIPATRPCLIVRQHELGDANGEPFPVQGPRNADVQIAVWYADTDSASETGNRDMHYVLRAATQSLRLLTSSSGAAGVAAQAAKTRDSITLWRCKEVRLVPAWEPLEDGILMGALLVTYQVRDTIP